MLADFLAESQKPSRPERTAFDLVQDNLRPLEAKDLEVIAEEEEGVGVSKISKRRAYGMNAARLCQIYLEAGISLRQVGPLIMDTMRLAANVELDKKSGSMKFSSKTVKRLALGVAHLDMAELINMILQAPWLLIAGDESLLKGDKKFPVFVACWDIVAGKPWWGLLRMCSMKDKTAETQATLFFETIVDVLMYP